MFITVSDLNKKKVTVNNKSYLFFLVVLLSQASSIVYEMQSSHHGTKITWGKNPSTSFNDLVEKQTKLKAHTLVDCNNINNKSLPIYPLKTCHLDKNKRNDFCKKYKSTTLKNFNTNKIDKTLHAKLYKDIGAKGGTLGGLMVAVGVGIFSRVSTRSWTKTIIYTLVSSLSIPVFKKLFSVGGSYISGKTFKEKKYTPEKKVSVLQDYFAPIWNKQTRKKFFSDTQKLAQFHDCIDYLPKIYGVNLKVKNINSHAHRKENIPASYIPSKLSSNKKNNHGENTLIFPIMKPYESKKFFVKSSNKGPIN